MRVRVLSAVVLLLGALLVSGARSEPAVASTQRADQLLAMLPRESAALGITSTYQVQDGDNLSGIADLLSVDVATMQQWNDIPDPGAIKVGQVLVVPDLPTEPVRYGLAPIKPHPNGNAPAMIWPAIGPITTKFGVPGPDWVGGFHMGLDIGAPMGAPIVAAAAGTVEFAGYDNRHGYGNNVLINVGQGCETLYGHMSRVIAKTGQTVQSGDLIGYVGDTGYAFGPHLHFEVRHNTVPIDPEPLLP